MSSSLEQPLLVNSYNHSIPTLIPSICFFVSFTALSILHLVKFITLKRTVHLYLLVFSLLRSCLFASRIYWSPNPNSAVLGIVSNVLLAGGFFVIIEAICALLSDWLFVMSKKREPNSSLPGFEYHLINLLKFLSPLFSIVGAIGEVYEFDIESETHIELALKLTKASSLGFLSLIIIYVMIVTYSAAKYGGGPIRKQLRALVLYILAALLLIELVYRTFSAFSHKSSPIYDFEWVFYVFECIPEIIILLILGGIILGEWFYSVDDSELMTQIARLQVRRKLDNNLQSGSTEEKETIKQGKFTEGETNSQAGSQANSQTIIINMNDDNRSARTNNTNNTNSTNSPV